MEVVLCDDSRSLIFRLELSTQSSFEVVVQKGDDKPIVIGISIDRATLIRNLRDKVLTPEEQSLSAFISAVAFEKVKVTSVHGLSEGGEAARLLHQVSNLVFSFQEFGMAKRPEEKIWFTLGIQVVQRQEQFPPSNQYHNYWGINIQVPFVQVQELAKALLVWQMATFVPWPEPTTVP